MFAKAAPFWLQPVQNTIIMDRQIDKKVLQKEKAVRLGKIIGGVIGFAMVVILISLLFRPSVSLREVSVSKVDTGNIDVTVSASGKIVSAFEEIINSPISSRILEVYKKSGDQVRQGDPILKLDLQSAQTDYNKLLDEEQMKVLQLEQLRLSNKSNLSEMRMNLEVKKMEVDRLGVEYSNERYLDSLGSGTTDKVRQAEMAYRVGQMQLKENEQKYENETALARANERVKELELNIFRKSMAETKRTLEDAQIRAPRTSVLSFVNTEIGAQVSQGTKVAMIADLDHFKVEGEIADSYGDRISIGSKAIVKVGREKYDGVVSNLAPASQNGVISFAVQLDEDNNAKLRSGLSCEIYIINSRKENVLRLANGSYYIGRGSYELFVMENGGNVETGGTMIKKPVRLGDCNFDYVEVAEGLKDGDIVLISDIGSKKIKDKIKLTK